MNKNKSMAYICFVMILLDTWFGAYYLKNPDNAWADFPVFFTGFVFFLLFVGFSICAFGSGEN